MAAQQDQGYPAAAGTTGADRVDGAAPGGITAVVTGVGAVLTADLAAVGTPDAAGSPTRASQPQPRSEPTGTTPAPAPSGSYSGDRARAWEALLEFHAAVVVALSEDLERADELSWGRYDVLVQLQAARHGLRLRDLGERLVISQPGLSRRIDRMAADGLVERNADPHDGRGVVVSATRAGRAALRRAAARHIPAVEGAFTDHLSDIEAQTLAAVLTRLRLRLPHAGRAGAR
ncbi:winged helix-turn-helix transcriptional regulator [Nakamurella flavida]|uniref:Winged helix-turn-helix transcriptional regulator n=1 Tax=Nakamurella flavida TaxID=363630 RepID=A0A938YMT1_9ACTN|nr:MarR family winged helix-turn-helix transcriptional regulator [Nakamurella flavida]MBM9475943.1 winged helix-turn-helix transcriptional regulator [Nakamurella flavida]MBM9478397.1 winged helix-turn-helix transcriptional regulator [Nakamurella flavida]MDP9777769.1 DNA-binding MarR family transcriptional regulator [Nakamurella flavida]